MASSTPSRSVSRQSSTTSIIEAAKAGWLEKRTSGGALSNKKWHKRWFQLSGTRIEYGKTDHHQVQVITLSRECHAELEGGKKTFCIITPTRKYHCRAKTPEDAQEWISAVKAARDSCKKRVYREVVLHRKSKEERLGITIGGGMDCANEGKRDIFIVKIDPEGLAADGLQKGDIIAEVNSKSFAAVTHAKAQKILATAKGDIVIKVSRRDRRPRTTSPPPAASAGASVSSASSPAAATVAETGTSDTAAAGAGGAKTTSESVEEEKARLRLERRNRLSQKRMERRESEKMEVEKALKLIDELQE